MTGENLNQPDPEDLEPQDGAAGPADGDLGADGADGAAGGQEPPEPAAPQWEPEDIEEAKLFGWKSPDEWQGDKPAGYIDNPSEYLDRVKRSRIFSTMQEKLDRHDQEARENARRLEAMNAQALERQKQQFESEMASISRQQRQAVADADQETFDRLELKRGELMKNQPQNTPEPTPQADPYLEQYRASPDGAWLENPVLFNTGRQLIDARPDIMAMPVQKQIEFAEAELRKMYPAYFPKKNDGNPAPKPQPRTAVDPGGLGTGAGGGGKASPAFGKLPADAKQQFKRFVDQGIFEDTKEDREEYANEYNAA